MLLELQRTLSLVDPAAIDALADRIRGAGQIMVAGAGRSGLMMRAFAMRLMHMGFRAYVVGETVTPGIGPGDLLLIGSGSGETRSLAGMAEQAAKHGADVAAVTIRPDSAIGRQSAAVVTVPAQPKDGAAGDTAEAAGAVTAQPMGTLFEQSLLIVLDAVVLNLMRQLEASGAAMYTKHANLE
ncbi:6-phospho 3-hexuloisomerase [Paenibacillus swuensis]|uniref:6-phospho 3-hexuloisomerase n=1 Tax=Paenibacillus swuensis TaxID=1178515 RepID=A0A172TP05_9BACL|nr:6-phospho-3-hexuloisomerase [Paenibacillus swuensis]ANE48795.1 6-phospho 3-hexuloisomerase [Paenibacillus swuensis]